MGFIRVREEQNSKEQGWGGGGSGPWETHLGLILGAY